LNLTKIDKPNKVVNENSEDLNQLKRMFWARVRKHAPSWGLNPTSLVVKHGFVEQSLGNAEAEKGYQFEREGYFCADSKDSHPEHLVFNLTVSLKEGF